MADNKSNRNYSDELCTISLHEQSEKNEKIPERITSQTNEKTNNEPENKQKSAPIILSKVQKVFDYFEKQGKPPVLTTAAILAKQAYFRPQTAENQINKKSFIELAHEYAGMTHEKTEHIPFMSYWPSYEYMSRKQLDWYFYMRGLVRGGEYVETDLSYIFLYIYEIINQVGINNPEDGLKNLTDIWINYRGLHKKLDRYLPDWTGDYINFYKCDAGQAFETLKKEGLFMLMPVNMLADYYFRNNLKMPVELISGFSDYKLYESGFIKSENGNLFISFLPETVHRIRCMMNEKKEGSFEQREVLALSSRLYKKFPFQRSTFNNPENVRIESYLPYESYKPLRLFITAVIKEFENQLRILTKYKGRLRPGYLPDEIKNICRTYAETACKGSQTEQRVEISIDREKLLALIQDSDEVRKKLIEGSNEYEDNYENAYVNEIETTGEPKPAEIIENSAQTALAVSENETAYTFKSSITPVQRKIIDYLLSKDGNADSSEINAAFPGIFIGVEIDKINDSALEIIGDLLIGFEDERWYIMEEYINEI